MFVFPHGIHVDRDGNIWVTDGQDNFPQQAVAAGRPSAPPAAAATRSVIRSYKFSRTASSPDVRQGRRESARQASGSVVVLSAERQ
jgi:hypothetical protein